MQRSFIFYLLGFAALFRTLSLATTIDFESSIIAFSPDKQYKFEVVPPRFKNRISYDFFQEANFLNLTASEGPDTAKAAAVTGQLYQKQKNEYVLIWSRPLASTIIPSRAFVLGTGTDILAVVDGQRREVKSYSNYFGFYDFNGACVTNGFYTTPHANSWSLKGKSVKLRDGRYQMIKNQ